MYNICKCFHEVQARVQENIARRKEVQGVCSINNVFAIATLNKLLGKIKEMYPQLIEEFCTKAVCTKVNENFFEHA